MVDSRLLVEGDPHQCVYALGDCAQVRGHHLPCTAQVAERQGRYLATVMAHKPTVADPLPDEFIFKPWGMLAYVGGYKAIHDTPLDKSQGDLVENTHFVTHFVDTFCEYILCQPRSEVVD